MRRRRAAGATAAVMLLALCAHIVYAAIGAGASELADALINKGARQLVTLTSCPFRLAFLVRGNAAGVPACARLRGVAGGVAGAQPAQAGRCNSAAAAHYASCVRNQTFTATWHAANGRSQRQGPCQVRCEPPFTGYLACR